MTDKAPNATGCGPFPTASAFQAGSVHTAGDTPAIDYQALHFQPHLAIGARRQGSGVLERALSGPAWLVVHPWTRALGPFRCLPMSNLG